MFEEINDFIIKINNKKLNLNHILDLHYNSNNSTLIIEMMNGKILQFDDISFDDYEVLKNKFAGFLMFKNRVFKSMEF